MNSIISINGEQVNFFINENCNWVFIRNLKEYEIIDLNDCYHLLPLIELDRDEVINKLQKTSTLQ